MQNVKIYYGIDLGTTFSSSCYVNINGDIKMVDTGIGQKNSVPSCVYYDDKIEDIKVGQSAVNLSKQNPSNLLYDSKRFFGKYYSEISKKEINSYPFKIIESDHLPFYELTYNGKIRELKAIEISSQILKHIQKMSIERITKENVSLDDIHVVIGIPAVFKYHQREATFQAAEKAGLKKITLLTEPSAAALAYVSSNHDQIIKKDNCNILVYDFGGGTFDVSIIHLKDKEISVKATFGDDHLGGQDVTHRLEVFITDDLKKNYKIDASNNSKLKQRIHDACDKSKIALSVAEEDDVYMEISGEEYSKTITTENLTELCSDLFKRTIDVVNETLKRAKMKPEDIDYIVLVGGSSRLPQVTKYINDSFKGIPICKSVNPDEAVAIGCGIYANYLLTGKSDFIIKDFIPPNPMSFGIDLGTTFSCSAFYNYSSRKCEMITTGQLTNTVPSVVAFDKKKNNIKVGSAAANCPMNNYSFATDAKRYICRNFKGIKEIDYQNALYKLVETTEGTCQFEVISNGKTEYYTPVNILGKILKHIKEMAIPKIPESIKENPNDFPVFLTVPADFSFLQREETKKAAKEAGLNIIHLINEPTAAAIAYIWNNEIKKDNCNIMVYDFGGGTFDVSILNVNGDDITVLSTTGDNHLGGQDITNLLCDYLIAEVEDKTKIKLNDKIRKRIRKQADDIKISLSSTLLFDFDIEIDDDNEYKREIRRIELVELCKDIFEKTIKKCKDAIKFGKIDIIDYIVLVGGSSRIPAVEEVLSNHFEGIPICKSINPDEAVSIGAALFGRTLQDETINHYRIVDVLSRSIGIGTKRALGSPVMTVIIDRCTKLPAKGSTVVTSKRGIAVVSIIEGDGTTLSSQFELGKVTVKVMNESSNVGIYFEVNVDGILHVTAKCNGVENSVEIDLSHPKFK